MPPKAGKLRLEAARQGLPRAQRRGHVLRLEDHVLAVVQAPVLRGDPALALQSPIECRSGKWNRDRISRQVDVRIENERDGLVERAKRVVIEAKHEAAHDGDAA